MLVKEIFIFVLRLLLINHTRPERTRLPPRSPLNFQPVYGHRFSRRHIAWGVRVHHTRHKMFATAAIISARRFGDISQMMYQYLEVAVTESVRRYIAPVYLHSFSATVAPKKNARILRQLFHSGGGKKKKKSSLQPCLSIYYEWKYA